MQIQSRGGTARESLDPSTAPGMAGLGGPPGLSLTWSGSQSQMGSRFTFACFPPSPWQTRVRQVSPEYLSSGLSTESAVEGILLAVVPSPAMPHPEAMGGTRPWLLMQGHPGDQPLGLGSSTLGWLPWPETAQGISQPWDPRVGTTHS